MHAGFRGVLSSDVRSSALMVMNQPRGCSVGRVKAMPPTATSYWCSVHAVNLPLSL